MRKSTMIALAAGLALSGLQTLTAAAAINYSEPKVAATPQGEVFTNAKGMTLYTSDNDLPGVSNCSGVCARHWPPALAGAGAKPTGELSLIKRDSGKLQWTDKSMPLYSDANDRKPGDITGDSPTGPWHVAIPG